MGGKKMDKVAEIIGVANVEFEGELIAYEADRDGHRVVLFTSFLTRATMIQ
jgi:hypothetical protein